MPHSWTLPARSARWAWTTATSGRSAETAVSSSPVNGHGCGRIVEVCAGRSVPDVAAHHRERQPGRAGDVAVRHPGVAVLLELEGVRPVALDRVAEPVQRADAGIASPGEHEPRAQPAPISWSKTRSGVMRTSVRSRRRWRISSCAGANGIRCVKPSSATVSPSRTTRGHRLVERDDLRHQRSVGERLLTLRTVATLTVSAAHPLEQRASVRGAHDRSYVERTPWEGGEAAGRRSGRAARRGGRRARALGAVRARRACCPKPVSRRCPRRSPSWSSLLGTGDFWTAVANTLQGWALGLGIAILLAVPAGILVGSSRLLYRALRVPIEFLRPIPSVALIPLAVLVYGTGLESKVFLAVFASFWPLFIQTLYGVQDVDPVADRHGALVRARPPRAGVAHPAARRGAVHRDRRAHLLRRRADPGRDRRAGDRIGRASAARSASRSPAARSTLMYALIIATGMLGWALNILATRGERRVLHWHPSQRELAA